MHTFFASPLQPCIQCFFMKERRPLLLERNVGFAAPEKLLAQRLCLFTSQKLLLPSSQTLFASFKALLR